MTWVISLSPGAGFNVDHYKASLKAHFGPATAYDIDHSGPKPINGPWINHSLIEFLENYKENKEKTGSLGSKDVSISIYNHMHGLHPKIVYLQVSLECPLGRVFDIKGINKLTKSNFITGCTIRISPNLVLKPNVPFLYPSFFLTLYRTSFQRMNLEQMFWWGV